MKKSLLAHRNDEIQNNLTYKKQNGESRTEQESVGRCIDSELDADHRTVWSATARYWFTLSSELDTDNDSPAQGLARRTAVADSLNSLPTSDETDDSVAGTK